MRDAGVRDVLEKERGFKSATIYPAGEDPIGLKGRARICKFFEARLVIKLDRENDAIADRVSLEFPRQMARLREVFEHLRRLPGNRPPPAALVALEAALDGCYRLVRQTEPTVQEVLRQLDALGDGLARLAVYAAGLRPKVALLSEGTGRSSASSPSTSRAARSAPPSSSIAPSRSSAPGSPPSWRPGTRCGWCSAAPRRRPRILGCRAEHSKTDEGRRRFSAVVGEPG